MCAAPRQETNPSGAHGLPQRHSFIRLSSETPTAPIRADTFWISWVAMYRPSTVLLLLLVLVVAGRASAQEPAAGKALVYVYRQHQLHGAGEHSIIFVNDYLLSELHLSEYAQLEVPQGSVVVTATLPYMRHIVPPTSAGYWASLPSCAGFAGLDWRRWAEASPVDVAHCYSELTQLVRECRVYTTTGGCAQPGCILVRTTHIPACKYKLNGLGDAFYLLRVAPQLPHVPTVKSGFLSQSAPVWWDTPQRTSVANW